MEITIEEYTCWWPGSKISHLKRNVNSKQPPLPLLDPDHPLSYITPLNHKFHRSTQTSRKPILFLCKCPLPARQEQHLPRRLLWKILPILPRSIWRSVDLLLNSFDLGLRLGYCRGWIIRMGLCLMIRQSSLIGWLWYVLPRYIHHSFLSFGFEVGWHTGNANWRIWESSSSPYSITPPPT